MIKMRMFSLGKFRKERVLGFQGVYLQEAIEFQYRTGRMKNVSRVFSLTFNINRSRVKKCLWHLGCDKALPNKFIYFILLFIKLLFDIGGGAGYICGTDCFMSFLGSF